MATCGCGSSALLRLVFLLASAAAFSHGGDETIPDSERGDENLAVRPSQIPGAGLGAFALRHFKKGEKVAVYKCDVKPNADDGEFVGESWGINDTHVCDGAPYPRANPALYVNSIAAKHTCKMQNVAGPPPEYLDWWANLGESGESSGTASNSSSSSGGGGSGGGSNAPSSPVYYRALRDIDVGEELFIDYGVDYFYSERRNLKLGPATRHVCSWVDKPAWPLYKAINDDNPDAVSRLLAKYPSLAVVGVRSAKGDGGGDSGNNDDHDDGAWTPLDLAIKLGNPEVVRAILLVGLKSHIGLEKVVQDLVNRPAAASSSGDTSGEDDPGAEALMGAAKDGHTLLVRALLEAGADVDTAAAMGFAPLHVASRMGHAEVVSELIERGAAVDINAEGGITPLHMAGQGGSLEIVELLLEAGADPQATTDGGETPVSFAAEAGHIDLIHRIMEALDLDLPEGYDQPIDHNDEPTTAATTTTTTMGEEDDGQAADDDYDGADEGGHDEL
eukprot:g570.t1